MQETTRIDFYRELMGWTFEEFGRRLEVSQQAAWRYCQPPTSKAHRSPRPKPADRLRQLSNGAVHAGNFSDIIIIRPSVEVAC